MSTVLREKGLKATFIQGFKSWPQQWPRVAMEVPSTGDEEKYGWIGEAPAMREFLGPRALKRLAKGTYTIVNKEWENSIEIPQTDIDDDQVGGHMMRIRNMGRKAAQHQDKIIFQTLIDSAYDTTCLDGQYFYDDDHVWPEATYSTSQDNDTTSNIGTTTNPTTVEFAAALKECLNALMSFKDDRGDPINPPGGQVILEGAPNFLHIFEKFTKANTLGDDAATNTELNVYKGQLAGYILNPWTANTERFRVHVLSNPVKPFILQMREALRTQAILAKAANPDFNAWNINASFFGSYARYNAGFGDWSSSVSHIFT